METPVMNFQAMIENFHFLRSAWLLTLIPFLLLLIYVIKHKLGSRSWDAICDQNLLPYILIGKPVGKQYSAVLLIALSGLLAILALAGPTWQQIPQPVFRDQSALIIALDLSRSMQASDIKPSRIARARFKIADILKFRKTGQTALLVYANDAYIVTPLTNDTKTIESQINALTTDIMPVQGNNTEVALEKASELLKQGGLTSGDVLLITDEVDYERCQHVVKKLLEQGYRLSVLGVGTEKGEPIPLAEGGFLKDSYGAIVIPAYDDRGPRQLASLGEGIYQPLTLDDSDVQKIIAGIDRLPVADDAEESQFQSDTWQEQGPWLLLLLIPLAAMSFRRGTIAVIIVMLMPMPDSAYAFDWQDLWLRGDQQAARDLAKGDVTGAAEKFSDPAWKAAAQYQAGDFSAAIETLDKSEDADNLYNKGNALARAGQYKEAINAYNQSLALMPENEDARYNRDLIEKELEKQEKQQQEQEEQEEQQQGDQKQEDQKDEDDKKDQDDSPSEENSEQNQESKDQQEQDHQGKQDQQQSEQNEGDNDQEQQPQKNEQNNNQQQEQSEESGEQIKQADTDPQTDEESQATEQWLRRIPDDPAGLLRRKFRYQYQQRDARQSQESQSW